MGGKTYGAVYLFWSGVGSHMSLAGFHTSMTVAWIGRDYRDTVCALCVRLSVHADAICGAILKKKCICVHCGGDIQPVTVNVGASTCCQCQCVSLPQRFGISIQRLIFPFSPPHASVCFVYVPPRRMRPTFLEGTRGLQFSWWFEGN